MKIFYTLLISGLFMAVGQDQGFFDYSNENAMLERFKDFEARKFTAIKQLERYGVFADSVDAENKLAASELARRVWLCIVQESKPNVFERKENDEQEVYKQYVKFYDHYYVKRDNLSKELKKYLGMFVRIDNLVGG